MEASKDNWESFGDAHGYWRTCTTAKTFGELSVLIHSTSDRSNPTEKQNEAISVINTLPQSKYDQALALIAERYDENVSDIECVFDLAEIPLIDQSPSTYFYLECDSPDDEHRITILFRNSEILGIVDRDAASEIFEWDAIDEIEALVLDDIDLGDADD